MILMILFLKYSFGQDSRMQIPKMKDKGFFMKKHCKDTVYLAVLQEDSLINIEHRYIIIDNNYYVSFINDTVISIGKFRRYNLFLSCNKKHIRMEKRRYWKLFDSKRKYFLTIDNYPHIRFILRLFPCFRLVIRNKKVL